MSLMDKRTHTAVEDHEHHSSAPYWIVWILLLILTVVTYYTGRMHMPTIGIYIAMAIAITKAALVVLWFMHLKEQKGVNRVVMTVSLIFVTTLFLGTFGDVFTRTPTLLPSTSAMMTRGINGNPPDPGKVPAGTHAPAGAVESAPVDAPAH